MYYYVSRLLLLSQMMRNSTVLVILLLIVFLVMVSYVHDLKINFAKALGANGANKPVTTTTTATISPDRTDIDTIEEADDYNYIITPNNQIATNNVVNEGKQAISNSTMIPLEPSKLLSVSKEIAYDPTEQIPLPVSGRFFESGEFHMVGHLTRVQGFSQGKHNSTSGTALPLYGQRVPTGKLAWVYAVIGNNGSKYIVHVPAPMDQGYTNCAESPNGCRQLVSGDMVAVPDIDEGALWRARMFTKL